MTNSCCTCCTYIEYTVEVLLLLSYIFVIHNVVNYYIIHMANPRITWNDIVAVVLVLILWKCYYYRIFFVIHNVVNYQ